MFTRRKRRPWVVWLPAALVLLAIGLWFGGHPSWLPSPLRSAFVSQSGNDRVINQVLGLLQNDYYRKVSRTKLVDSSLESAVASLDDPYSHYYDPPTYRTFQDEDTNPHVSGIGVNLYPEPDPRGLRVQSVFAGSPAAKAGLAPGDLIVAVGRTSLAHRSLGFSSSLIKGRPGTKVTLTIDRGGRARQATLTRQSVVVPVASGQTLTYHGQRLGYLRLTSFAVGAGDELRSQVSKQLRAGARGLILDLRDNGGGLVDEAVNVASIFIPHGTILSTDGRAQPRHVYLAKQNAIAPKIPMVVLVDENTASAAEIVTGALKDHGRAKVVGTHTYGKGVFQEIEPLSNGGALDFTVGEYFTPDGQNLGGGGVTRGKGLQPDIHAQSPRNATPGSRADTALTTAERAVAAEIR